MNKLLVLSIFIFSVPSVHAADLFLFQSTNDLNKAVVVPRDIKKPTLIVSIGDECPDCGTYLKDFLHDFVKKDRAQTDIIIARESNLWRKARDQFRESSWVPSSLTPFTYHDPSGRYRKELGAQRAVYLTLYAGDGKILKKLRLDKDVRYTSLMGRGK